MAVERVVATMVLDRMTEAVMAEAEMAAEREASGEGGGDGGGGNGKGDGGGELGGGEGGGVGALHRRASSTDLPTDLKKVDDIILLFEGGELEVDRAGAVRTGGWC